MNAIGVSSWIGARPSASSSAVTADHLDAFPRSIGARLRRRADVVLCLSKPRPCPSASSLRAFCGAAIKQGEIQRQICGLFGTYAKN
ncbi:hypothetical protein [Mesorhizobium sp. M0859]|uniref:hypothetical protein n=1 Tax=Mesorhizobium sp. M0859 TaxID=2957014 RepID=UPI003335A987